MSKKDGAKPKPAKGKDKAKKESGVQPDLNAIREAVVATNDAKPAPFPDLVEEAHLLLGKIADQIDVPVKTKEGYAEFASLAERFNFINREVKVGREAIAELEMKKHVFETFLDDGLQLSERYGSEEVISWSPIYSVVSWTASLRSTNFAREDRLTTHSRCRRFLRMRIPSTMNLRAAGRAVCLAESDVSYRRGATRVTPVRWLSLVIIIKVSKHHCWCLFFVQTLYMLYSA